jgi:hypothetical protein
MKIESFKSPSLAGFFFTICETICDLKVLFHGAPKKILTKKIIYKGHREVLKLEGPRGENPSENPISLYGQSRVLPKYITEVMLLHQK